MAEPKGLRHEVSATFPKRKLNSKGKVGLIRAGNRRFPALMLVKGTKCPYEDGKGSGLVGNLGDENPRLKP